MLFRSMMLLGRALGGAGSSISVSACLCNRRRRASGPLVSRSGPPQMGGEKLPSDERSGGGGPGRSGRGPLTPTPPPPPLSIHPTSPSPSFLDFSPVHRSSSLCDCRHGDRVGSDKVLGLMDGQRPGLDERMDEGENALSILCPFPALDPNWF